MYILQRGEVKIDYDPNAPKETVEFYAPGARVGGARKVDKKKSTKDGIRGRTDKMGTLIGFADVFQKLLPLPYTVLATSRCTLLSITRSQLKELLTTYTEDRPIIQKAIDQANSTIENSAPGAGSRRTSNMVKKAGTAVIASSGRPSSEDGTAEGQRTPSMLDQIEADDKAREQAELSERTKRASTPGPEGAGKMPVMVEGVSSDEVADLRRKLDTLTKIVSEQFRMIEQQNSMLVQMVPAQLKEGFNNKSPGPARPPQSDRGTDGNDRGTDGNDAPDKKLRRSSQLEGKEGNVDESGQNVAVLMS